MKRTTFNRNQALIIQKQRQELMKKQLEEKQNGIFINTNPNPVPKELQDITHNHTLKNDKKKNELNDIIHNEKLVSLLNSNGVYTRDELIKFDRGGLSAFQKAQVVLAIKKI